MLDVPTQITKETVMGTLIEASNFAVHDRDGSVSFTFGPGITLQDERGDVIRDLSGTRGLISYFTLKCFLETFVPAVLKGTPGRVNRFHQMTPEQALKLQKDAENVLFSAQTVREQAVDRVPQAPLYS